VGVVLLGSITFVVWTFVAWEARPAELFPDFQMFPSARTFDPPGSIFRINHDGIRYDVADISSEVATTGGFEDIPDQTGRRRVDGNFLGGLLNDRASGSVSASGSYIVSLKVSGAVRESTSDLNLDRALALALKEVSLRTDNRYFIIRETIAVRQVDYELATADLESVAAKVGVTPASNSKVALKQLDSGSSALIGRYETPYRLFYKVEQIQFNSNGLNGDLKLSREPVRKVLDWRDPPPAK
jgi:hypothetical protein